MRLSSGATPLDLKNHDNHISIQINRILRKLEHLDMFSRTPRSQTTEMKVNGVTKFGGKMSRIDI
jgi:hypothetical protein